MSSSSTKVVTRFAPSPTGFMHVGGVRTALYAWAWAKKNNGTFILRIEDTDRAREVEGSISHIMESLTWLGITWDEGPDIGGPHAPYIQSERLDIYNKYAQMLIDKGYAYPDPYSEEEVALFRQKAAEEKRAFLYRDHRPETFGIWDGSQSLRLKVPHVTSYTWVDAVRGELSAGEEALDDFILIKSDGYPTYNFAHIVDDLEMGVTHIMRADEFIASIPKFLSLYEALGIVPPVFVALPPILGKDGTKKLGKRDGAKGILEYRDDGFLPEAMMNFLALTGWHPEGDKEFMSKDEFIALFDINKIHSGGAMVNDDKLLWMNKEYMKQQPEDIQLTEITRYLPTYNKDVLAKIRPLIIDRISFYGEIPSIEAEAFRYFVERPSIIGELCIWKHATREETIVHLKTLQGILQTVDRTSPETIKQTIMPYADAHGKGNVLWPLRMVLSGQEKSTDPFTLCYVLPALEVEARINAGIEALTTAPLSS